jgi:Zinc finger, C3HC4 type (RING finger)
MQSLTSQLTTMDEANRATPIDDKNAKVSKLNDGCEESQMKALESTDTSVFIQQDVRSGRVVFDVEKIREQVICTLCGGLFREPYTTLKCYHTFCKSCLAAALFSGRDNTCPRCDLYLGRQVEISKLALPDRTLETLIDHVFFPEIAKADREMEADFYERRGIARKNMAATKKARTFDTNNREETISFCLLPDHTSADDRPPPPRLPLPILETNGNIRIGQLKKYLAAKLLPMQKSSPFTHPEVGGGDCPTHGGDFEILCNSVPLGNELSVKFVLRTVWMDLDQRLTLTYRYG